MNFFVENWQLIAGIAVFVVVLVVLILLYRKNRINEDYMSMLIDYLDTIDDSDGIVPLLAGYAKRAVMAVEQMVKAGVIPKTNEARKDMAAQIIQELAAADGVELDDSAKTAVQSLIESEVYDIRN